MTAVLPDHPDVEVVSEAELRHAVAKNLEDLGLTFDQLAAQAATGDFTSTRARLVWIAIGDLHDLAE